MKNRIRKTGEKNRWKKYLLVSAVMLFLCLNLSGNTNTTQAASTYQIKVNKQANCVTIYKLNANGKYEPVKALICSTGWATKTGTYSLGEKMRWHTLDGPCYGQYCTRIYGGVLFHSVWYTGVNNPATLSVSSYNRLGTTASHGCVRLTVAGAKWIYDNVPSGTPVIIYNSSDPGPLGKPEAIKLPYSTGWDPTDIWNPGNPWNKKKPSISGAKNQTVEYNGNFDVLKGVKAKNTTGFDATSRLRVKITYHGKRVKKVDTRKPGTYRVTYQVKDEIGRKAQQTVKIKITGKKPAPKIKGVKDLYVKSKSSLTKGYALKHVTITQNGKKLPNKYVTVQFKKLKKNVYRVTYLAQNASEQTKAVAKAYIDKKAPKITGVVNGSSYPVEGAQTVNKEYVLGLIQVSDNLSKLTTKDVKVTIVHEEAENRYKVTYTVSDQAGNKTKVTIYLVKTATQPVSGSAVGTTTTN